MHQNYDDICPKCKYDLNLRDKFEEKRDLIDYLLHIGEARHILSQLLHNDLFDNLSKHNPYWSETVDAIEKLNSIRLSLYEIKESLFDINEKLE
jgi:hypothetical protein